MKMNEVGGFFMKRSERQLMWQSRIQAFHTSGEASVAAWCAKENVQTLNGLSPLEYRTQAA